MDYQRRSSNISTLYRIKKYILTKYALKKCIIQEIEKSNFENIMKQENKFLTSKFLIVYHHQTLSEENIGQLTSIGKRDIKRKIQWNVNYGNRKMCFQYEGIFGCRE